MKALRIMALFLMAPASLALGATAPAADPPAPVATIAQGKLSGQSLSGGIDSFRGIPYAAPPVGPLRWRPPAKAPAWSGVRDASQFGPSCLQEKLGGADSAGARANPVRGATSEDCLTLNVWTPAKHDKPLPVMVWIHGGAHRVGSGSAPFYDGATFARDGVVLVTINYRLGQFGYFAHPALTKAAGADEPLANYGTMDQIAALKWVRDNIAAFGGDPGNVTVFGESAGGVATLLMLTVPDARGLFQKAIVESGGGWSRMKGLSAAEADGAATAKAAGLGDDATADQLRALPADKIGASTAGLGFGPVVDGRLVKESIPAAFAKGHAVDVPLIIGFNSDEGSLMQSFGIPPAGLLATLPDAAKAAMKASYGDRAKDDAALARRLFADGGFSAPARWIAGQSAGGAPAWLYRFDYVPVVMRARRDGVIHGGEIPFVFDSWGAIPALAAYLDPADKAEVATVHGCWVAFAKTGVPSCPGAPAWPAYTKDGDTLMNFAAPNATAKGFDKGIYDVLEQALLPRALAPAN